MAQLEQILSRHINAIQLIINSLRNHDQLEQAWADDYPPELAHHHQLLHSFYSALQRVLSRTDFPEAYQRVEPDTPEHLERLVETFAANQQLVLTEDTLPPTILMTPQRSELWKGHLTLEGVSAELDTVLSRTKARERLVVTPPHSETQSTARAEKNVKAFTEALSSEVAQQTDSAIQPGSRTREGFEAIATATTPARQVLQTRIASRIKETLPTVTDEKSLQRAVQTALQESIHLPSRAAELIVEDALEPVRSQIIERATDAAFLQYIDVRGQIVEVTTGLNRSIETAVKTALTHLGVSFEPEESTAVQRAFHHAIGELVNEGGITPQTPVKEIQEVLTQKVQITLTQLSQQLPSDKAAAILEHADSVIKEFEDNIAGQVRKFLHITAQQATFLGNEKLQIAYIHGLAGAEETELNFNVSNFLRVLAPDLAPRTIERETKNLAIAVTEQIKQALLGDRMYLFAHTSDALREIIIRALAEVERVNPQFAAAIREALPKHEVPAHLVKSAQRIASPEPAPIQIGQFLNQLVPSDLPPEEAANNIQSLTQAILRSIQERAATEQARLLNSPGEVLAEIIPQTLSALEGRLNPEMAANIREQISNQAIPDYLTEATRNLARSEISPILINLHDEQVNRGIRTESETLSERQQARASMTPVAGSPYAEGAWYASGGVMTPFTMLASPRLAENFVRGLPLSLYGFLLDIVGAAGRVRTDMLMTFIARGELLDAYGAYYHEWIRRFESVNSYQQGAVDVNAQTKSIYDEDVVWWTQRGYSRSDIEGGIAYNRDIAQKTGIFRKQLLGVDLFKSFFESQQVPGWAKLGVRGYAKLYDWNLQAAQSKANIWGFTPTLALRLALSPYALDYFPQLLIQRGLSEPLRRTTNALAVSTGLWQVKGPPGSRKVVFKWGWYNFKEKIKDKIFKKIVGSFTKLATKLGLTLTGPGGIAAVVSTVWDLTKPIRKLAAFAYAALLAIMLSGGAAAMVGGILGIITGLAASTLAGAAIGAALGGVGVIPGAIGGFIAGLFTTAPAFGLLFAKLFTKLFGPQMPTLGPSPSTILSTPTTAATSISQFPVAPTVAAAAGGTVAITLITFSTLSGSLSSPEYFPRGGPSGSKYIVLEKNIDYPLLPREATITNDQVDTGVDITYTLSLATQDKSLENVEVQDLIVVTTNQGSFAITKDKNGQPLPTRYDPSTEPKLQRLEPGGTPWTKSYTIFVQGDSFKDSRITNTVSVIATVADESLPQQKARSLQVIIGFPPLPPGGIETITSAQLYNLILEASNLYGVPPGVLFAISHREAGKTWLYSDADEMAVFNQYGWWGLDLGSMNNGICPNLGKPWLCCGYAYETCSGLADDGTWCAYSITSCARGADVRGAMQIESRTFAGLIPLIQGNLGLGAGESPDRRVLKHSIHAAAAKLKRDCQSGGYICAPDQWTQNEVYQAAQGYCGDCLNPNPGGPCGINYCQDIWLRYLHYNQDHPY